MKNLVSLNEAKFLKELGFKKPTEYYYLDKDLKYIDRGLNKTKNGRKINHNRYDEFIYSAPTKKQSLHFFINRSKHVNPDTTK